MSPRRIALFGGSMNPPGLHHRAMAEALARRFDQVWVIPCGPRPDKASTEDIPTVNRAAMADLAFRGLKGVEVELFDLEGDAFTRAWALEERFSADGELWHAVPAHLLRGGATGQSVIQRLWTHGHEIWRNLRWAVCHTPDAVPAPEDLPPHAELIRCEVVGASAAIRERAFRNDSIVELLDTRVADYVTRRGLYRGAQVRRGRYFALDSTRPLVLCDERNPRATEMRDAFRARYPAVESIEEDPSCIVVMGGDGTMLHAIRKHWRRRIPFFGVNVGHLGFLLNGIDDVLDGLPKGAIHREIPLIRVDTRSPEGASATTLGFNDAWVEREGGQTAWVEVRVNGEVRLPKVVCDGVLVSTAAGSTSYARAMGVAPLQVDTPLLILTGSNVMQPDGWRLAHLPLDARIELRSLDLHKRPLRGFVDGAPTGPIESMHIRTSRIAAAELAFVPDHDIAQKLTAIQFPNV